jgi:predicted dehydrogenase
LIASPLALAARREIRVGVIGTGSRGTGLMRLSLELPGVRVTAVCDIEESRATNAQNIVERAQGSRPAPFTRGPEDYKRLCERQDVDAVIIATPQTQHAPQAIFAMQADKHVGSETPAAYTLDEAWALVEAKEKTGRRYMFLENYPYARHRMMLLHMAHTGVFGDITYGESSYIHDTRALAYEKDGAISWRGEIAHKYRGDVYPTHALGPISLWMGINRGDRLVSMVSMDSGTRALQSFAAERWGKTHPAAQPGFFAKRDVTITLMRTAQEKLIVLRYDSASTRPAGGWEQLQGTKGGFDGSPGRQLIYLQGRSAKEQWEPLDQYYAQHEHPYWKRDAATAAKTGHGGGDYFVMREFFAAVAEDREPPIDVYDAAAWSAVLPLSATSIAASNRAIEVPDFTRGAWKSRKLAGFGI